jgi:hypothetical protein
MADTHRGIREKWRKTEDKKEVRDERREGDYAERVNIDAASFIVYKRDPLRDFSQEGFELRTSLD